MRVFHAYHFSLLESLGTVHTYGKTVHVIKGRNPCLHWTATVSVGFIFLRRNMKTRFVRVISDQGHAVYWTHANNGKRCEFSRFRLCWPFRSENYIMWICFASRLNYWIPLNKLTVLPKTDCLYLHRINNLFFFLRRWDSRGIFDRLLKYTPAPIYNIHIPITVSMYWCILPEMILIIKFFL